MFLIKKTKSLTTSALAKKHTDGLIKEKVGYKGKGLPFENGSIARRIEKSIGNTSGKSKRFFTDLKASNYKLLREILSGEPEKLNRIINSVNKKIRERVYPQITFKAKGEKTKKFGDHIEYVFNYDAFCDKDTEWNAYDLAEELGVDVCIYCNRNYTYTFIDKGRGVVRPEFDHFFAKSLYPYLALSFFNLIPSCHICNSNLKRDIPFSYTKNLHPYNNSLDDTLRFSVELLTKSKLSKIAAIKAFGSAFFYGNLASFEIKLLPKNKIAKNQITKANRNNEVFKISELYHFHKDLVVEMIQNAIIYNDAKVDELFKKFGGTLFRSKDDVLRHVTKNFHLPDDMPKRPFSKLTKDIHKEFGIKY